MALTEKELIKRDAKRNIDGELLASIQDTKAGRHGTANHVKNKPQRKRVSDATKP
ncbi:hypothetical protein [Pseudomonas maioricensis]|uniref:hypothetical protein n=1 Tax=Pseudomonas maioricensis TaxID=1766623 RepID=UPI001FACC678|nr:hypothetical protein [Pseudomonas sp. S25]